MSISIVKEHDAGYWNELLAQSSQATPFHRYECLTTCAEYADATLYPYVGYKGEEPVGLFPVFEIKKGPFSVAFSPVPDLKIHYLGPVLLNHGKLKSRKREQRNQAFIEAVFESISDDIDPRYITVRTTPYYTDERPFRWAGYDGTGRQTYVIDLTADRAELLESFSSDLRTNIRNDNFEGFEITPAAAAEIDRIIQSVIALHDRKGVDYHLTPSFVRDMFERLPDKMVHAHVCRYDGEFCGGEIALEYDDTVYGWQSAADVSVPVPIYDLLYWHALQAAKDRGCTTYDLLGANNRTLSEYKSKFAPELRRYHTLDRGGWEMKLAAQIYKRLR